MAAIALEADAVVDAIITNLIADTTPSVGTVALIGGARIYRDVVPDSTPPTAYPIVTVSWLAADDNTTADGTHVLQNVTVLTKVTDKGNSYVKTLAIASRIATRLNMLEGITTGGAYIAKIWRTEMPPQPSDYINGVRYIYSNQIWRAVAEPA